MNLQSVPKVEGNDCYAICLCPDGGAQNHTNRWETKPVFLYCYPDCPADAVQLDKAIWAAIEKYSLEQVFKSVHWSDRRNVIR